MISKNITYVVFVFLAVVIGSCVTVKENALYIETPNPNDTVFYTSSEIYSDYITSEGWVTESKPCITARTSNKAAFEGELGIDLQWDRSAAGCPWLGFGFGWDSWTGKDLSGIKNTAAIQFHVRTIEGQRTNLPWALGLEDFTGAQAWLGVTSNCIKAEKITTEWTRVEMPLSEFNWDEQGANASNIKQIIFNTEADGHVYIDEIKIVPYSGGFRKRANVNHITSDEFVVDGKTDDKIWKTDSIKFGSNELHLAIVENFLCIALRVKDENPLQNSFSGKDVYNGDAFEISFSTDKNVSTRRSRYMSADQHIGFGLSKDGIKAWDWSDQKELKTKIFKALETSDGYIFEAKINLNDLDLEAFESGLLYGLEVAVDHGDATGRIMQERWNNASMAGFHENPSLWGEMYIVPALEANK